MVEVFKTNVRTRKQSAEILKKLSELFPHSKINFDLSDCDRILRVENEVVYPKQIIRSVNNHGFQCLVLE
jgi:hypothetical protein